ncbi:hypothetical protein J6590_100932 [Homalodisca vitripennis]|nr:hypothetical protein J6590_100932 [Homalodisca vitripennis]
MTADGLYWREITAGAAHRLQWDRPDGNGWRELPSVRAGIARELHKQELHPHHHFRRPPSLTKNGRRLVVSWSWMHCASGDVTLGGLVPVAVTRS